MTDMKAENPSPARAKQNELARVAKYLLWRVATLFLTTVVALYITILVANMGGYVDEMIKGGIDENISMMLRGGWLKELPLEEKNKVIETTKQEMYAEEGLNQPFLLRSFRWLKNGITLDLGDARVIVALRYGNDSTKVRDIILDNLPRTLLLFASANLLLFVASVWFALVVSRNYHSLLDKIFVALSPISSAPAWFYGIFLIAIFAVKLRILPYGGMYGTDPAEARNGYALVVLRHMILPVSAIFLSGFFQSVYSWRTFFLIYSHDDYVELARARGLSKSRVERRYLVRPALPALLTSFSFLLISSWSGSMLLEWVFRWPGMGNAFFTSVNFLDTPVIVGFTIVYAYVIMLTILILDIAYVLLDPRVKIDFGGSARAAPRGWSFSFPRIFPARRKKPRVFFARQNLADWLGRARAGFRSAGGILREILQYPSALVGAGFILVMLGISIYVSLTIPYETAIKAWRGQDYDWSENPFSAPPAWTNWFRKDDLPLTQVFDTRVDEFEERVISNDNGMMRAEMRYAIQYPYRGGFPQDLVITLEPVYEKKPPFVLVKLIAPDGRETRLFNSSVEMKEAYYLSQDKKLQIKLNNPRPQDALFGSAGVPLTGTYQFVAEVIRFEETADIEIKTVVHGQVYGWAGTDLRRRDLGFSLLWGMPVALIFGLLAVIGTTITTMILAAVGTWFGGWVDALIQRLTEVNMILPLLPMLAMVAAFYERSIWLILGVTILLSIFGSAIKNYRAVFLQFKELPYIEAAQSYGAGNWRIIFHYLVPRILPILVPQMVVLVPGYVFLEASLSLMGMSDPRLPTWGKILRDAYENNALIHGYYYWVLEPLAFLLFTGVGFALLGFALDRIFNPRLRES